MSSFANFEKKEATVGSSNSNPPVRLCLAAALGALSGVSLREGKVLSKRTRFGEGVADVLILKGGDRG